MKTIIGKVALGLAAATFITTSAHALLLYTSQPEADATQTVEAFKQANPGVEVEIFRSGTSDLLSKLAAEIAAGNPQPDVLLIADAVSMELLKADGHLMPYPEADVSGLEETAYDADRTYFGSKLITTGIAYNTAAPEKPESWKDLTGEAYKNLIVMPSPLYSGAAAYLLAGFTNRDDLGWDYFESLKENGLVTVQGNGAVLRSVATGEKAYGILVDFMAMNAKNEGSPIGFVFPEEGVPAVTEPVAIMSSAKNVEEAKKFVDFILSDEGQKLALEQGYLPANPSVGQPEWLPEGTQVNVMQIDIDAVVKTIDADKERFSQIFGG
ncbi:ABC transporter substrate-binding protein [Chelativorans sp. Marseille-P2723]|uniref:ABC transporter substrate-binding protein n=1 Tax=Chelativorans sp. Marseille-P2723 TaxID=2709133 RepID=UPI001570D18F|nr:ABC transporter substrate-binding protein [Chelativorans sp. Marseille-P2723]